MRQDSRYGCSATPSDVSCVNATTTEDTSLYEIVPKPWLLLFQRHAAQRESVIEQGVAGTEVECDTHQGADTTKLNASGTMG